MCGMEWMHAGDMRLHTCMTYPIWKRIFPVKLNFMICDMAHKGPIYFLVAHIKYGISQSFNHFKSIHVFLFSYQIHNAVKCITLQIIPSTDT